MNFSTISAFNGCGTDLTNGPREAEVSKADVPILREKNVRRFDVTVYEALSVDMGQDRDALPEHVLALAVPLLPLLGGGVAGQKRHVAPADPLLQCAAVDKLHLHVERRGLPLWRRRQYSADPFHRVVARELHLSLVCCFSGVATAAARPLEHDAPIGHIGAVTASGRAGIAIQRRITSTSSVAHGNAVALAGGGRVHNPSADFHPRSMVADSARVLYGCACLCLAERWVA
mmetsp:Transcript_89322/g.251447  ORF Transcript_89322/g.251447 Transcript_89322/m.251447 type:complete len:231 (+) Transcript_89322:696-1388(+)